MSIEYRNVRYEDWTELANFFSKSWFFKGIIDDTILDTYSRYFLLNAYQHASFCYVAVKETKIVGFLMGQIASQFVKDEKICNEVKQLEEQLGYHPHFQIMRKTIVEYYKLADKMIVDSNMQVKDELILFCVDNNCRGQGIGKTLLNMAYTAYREANVHELYLVTDSICHYQTYDHMGFNQHAHVPFTFTLPNEQRDISIFIYTFSI